MYNFVSYYILCVVFLYSYAFCFVFPSPPDLLNCTSSSFVLCHTLLPVVVLPPLLLLLCDIDRCDDPPARCIVCWSWISLLHPQPPSIVHPWNRCTAACTLLPGNVSVQSQMDPWDLICIGRPPGDEEAQVDISILSIVLHYCKLPIWSFLNVLDVTDVKRNLR